MTGRYLKQGQKLDYPQSLTCMYYGECGGWTTQTYSSAKTSYMKSPGILEGFEPFLKADVGTLQNNKPAFRQLIMCVWSSIISTLKDRGWHWLLNIYSHHVLVFLFWRPWHARMQCPQSLCYFLCYKLCNNPQPVQYIYINTYLQHMVWVLCIVITCLRFCEVLRLRTSLVHFKKVGCS